MMRKVFFAFERLKKQCFQKLRKISRNGCMLYAHNSHIVVGWLCGPTLSPLQPTELAMRRNTRKIGFFVRADRHNSWGRGRWCAKCLPWERHKARNGRGYFLSEWLCGPGVSSPQPIQLIMRRNTRKTGFFVHLHRHNGKIRNR